MFGQYYFAQGAFAQNAPAPIAPVIGPPITIWQPTSGNGEASVPGILSIVDSVGVFLVDPSLVNITDTGIDLVVLAQSLWGSAELPPQTIWAPSNGNGEAVVTGLHFIVDPTGVFLVDELGYDVVDTGTNILINQQSVWVRNDSI